MKLTKLQRYTAYCILLEEAENPSLFIYPNSINGILRKTNVAGLCWMWKMVFGDNSLYELFEEMTPELYNKLKSGRLNFQNWKERKEALKQCIIETHP